MHFIPGEFYHVYNRGNNRQRIFFHDDNYLFFLKKISGQLKPVSEIIAYCLMPNHFHILVQATASSIKERQTFGGKPMQDLAYRIGVLLSSYCQAINKQNKTTGSLFQQKTKAKILNEENNTSGISYLEQCFCYIHQNPLVAGLVTSLSDWPYSSYLDYAGLRNDSLCRKEIFFNHTGFQQEDIVKICSAKMEEKLIDKLF
ncbi:MAG TPA: transposase [Chitinophagaceae bacterium]|jgi:putative transposase|nr:transposase [Chitinophagaceae bacterium]